MRNNLVVFALAHLLLILLLSVGMIALHYMPGLEAFLYRHMLFRIVPVVLMLLVYGMAGKLMSMRTFVDTLALWLVPGLIWGVLIAAAYLGGGSDAFFRGPFRSLWRFPADVAMLPQVVIMGLMRLRYDPLVQLVMAFVPQSLTAVVAWYSMHRYRKMAAYRRRKAAREERR